MIEQCEYCCNPVTDHAYECIGEEAWPEPTSPSIESDPIEDWDASESDSWDMNDAVIPEPEEL